MIISDPDFFKQMFFFQTGFIYAAKRAIANKVCVDRWHRKVRAEGKQVVKGIRVLSIDRCDSVKGKQKKETKLKEMLDFP